MIKFLRLRVILITLGIIHWKDAVCTPLNLNNRLLDFESTVEVEPEAYRLNEDVWPTHYDLEIKPYFANESNKAAFTFDGITTITITALKEGVTSIKLHQLDLDIQSWYLLRRSNSQIVRQGNKTYDLETEILTLTLAEPLLPNVEYLLSFHYIGAIQNELHGFFRSSFNRSGEQVWFGTTQFQATDARRAFPCFDEPKFKATFELKINHKPLEYSVYSNTPIRSSVDVGNNRSLTTFGVTPKMSTYLLAFIVAPFEVTGEDRVRVLAPPGVSRQTSYAVQAGLKLLQYLEDWINYSVDNFYETFPIYMAAMPVFPSGAMENWGLIIYKESLLLYDPVEDTSLDKQKIATTIAHELAHQWFGNLVTCDWWNVTWLNEGFATYLEYFGTASVEPDWELEQQFVVHKLQKAMQLDVTEWTHAVTSPVHSSNDVLRVFDDISYNKAAAVLRMVEHFLTSPIFQLALREYVKAQAFQTARPEHLFAVLNRHKANTSAYIEPWTTQPGFPLVTVSITEGGFTLTQKRFFANGTDNNENSLWPIPVTYATKPEDFANTMPTFLTASSYNVSVPNASSVRYFIVNNQQVGYYRVNYEPNLWEKISNALRSDNYGGIHVLNRAQIVDDLFNLAAADVMSYTAALNILDYLKTETEYLPWRAAINGLEDLSLKIHADDEKLFSNYILHIFESVYKKVDFRPPVNSERRVDSYLRREVLQWTCRHGHEDCRRKAEEEFERFRKNPSVNIHPDLREIVYCEGVRNGSAIQFDFLLNRYQAANTTKESDLILKGLSCVEENDLIHVR
ncbi:AGAP013146-PA-like protein [Anopheles sinensis]|uniref:Aminopeptidase n=1 Tax=Anopheles sinensis TaxID=74873 RepID=A0A084WR44_ANOSI|nr:AGAP013146-PA-like protein [Anopheles sinensis]